MRKGINWMSEEDHQMAMAAQMQQILQIVRQWGWCAAFPVQKPDDEVVGLIIGSQEYVQAVCGYLPQIDRFWEVKEEPKVSTLKVVTEEKDTRH